MLHLLAVPALAVHWYARGRAQCREAARARTEENNHRRAVAAAYSTSTKMTAHVAPSTGRTGRVVDPEATGLKED